MKNSVEEIIQAIDWARETINEKLMFGQDEPSAGFSRERRACGVLLECKKFIEQLKEELKKERECVDILLKYPKDSLHTSVCDVWSYCDKAKCDCGSWDFNIQLGLDLEHVNKVKEERIITL